MAFLRALEANYGYLLTTKLVILSAFFRSAAFAYAAVACLLVTLAREVYKEYLSTKSTKNTLPEETKKRIQDVEARITSIEAGIQRRGF